MLEICHTTHYKKKILNYFIASDGNLQILKTISFILRKAKNKVYYFFIIGRNGDTGSFHLRLSQQQERGLIISHLNLEKWLDGWGSSFVEEPIHWESGLNRLQNRNALALDEQSQQQSPSDVPKIQGRRRRQRGR